jgi:hypothetical protein
VPEVSTSTLTSEPFWRSASFSTPDMDNIRGWGTSAPETSPHQLEWLVYHCNVFHKPSSHVVRSCHQAQSDISPNKSTHQKPNMKTHAIVPLNNHNQTICKPWKGLQVVVYS